VYREKKMGVLLILCAIFIALLTGNIYKFLHQTKMIQEKLNCQNKKIIFVNNPDMDIKSECYKAESFFKMHNNGNNPCEKILDFQYIHYAHLNDYYL